MESHQRFDFIEVGGRMELKYLYTVKKIIETGSYQEAAAALHYAPSTITFQVRELERELHTRLFEKRAGRMVLTQAGQALLPQIDQVLSSVQSLLRQGEGQPLRGTLTIALPESLSTYELQPVLRDFREQAPQVRLVLRVMNCFAIRRQLGGSEIDLAIHYDVGPYREGICTVPLRSYSLVLVGSPDLTPQQRDFVTPHQHKELCHIRNDADALYLRQFRQYLRERDITLEPSLELWSIESIKRSVMSRLGVACLPRFTVEEELRQGLLAELPTRLPGHELRAICAYERGRWMSPAMDCFLRVLKSHFAG